MDYATALLELVDGHHVGRPPWAVKYLELYQPPEGSAYIRMTLIPTGKPIEWPEEEIAVDTAANDWEVVS